MPEENTEDTNFPAGKIVISHADIDLELAKQDQEKFAKKTETPTNQPTTMTENKKSKAVCDDVNHDHYPVFTKPNLFEKISIFFTKIKDFCLPYMNSPLGSARDTRNYYTSKDVNKRKEK